MFRKLFAARSSHPAASQRSCRLELEPLEDRLAPVTIGNFMPFPNFSVGVPSFGPAAPTFNPGAAFRPISFSGANTAGGTNAFAGAASTANQLAQMEQQISILFPIAASINAAQATSLVINEFFLAVETFTVFQSQAHSVYHVHFQDLPARENAINQNPLQRTFVGQELGSLVFDATALLLSSRVSGAGTGV